LLAMLFVGMSVDINMFLLSRAAWPDVPMISPSGQQSWNNARDSSSPCLFVTGTNQAPVQQHSLQGQHVGGMQSLQTAGMAQPGGQGVQFTNMDCHLQQVYTDLTPLN